MRLLFGLLLLACGRPVYDEVPDEPALHLCQKFRDCDYLDTWNMDMSQCESARSQTFEACDEDTFNRGEGKECLQELMDASCADLEEPVEEYAPSCFTYCL
jgi:hypothetical protein